LVSQTVPPRLAKGTAAVKAETINRGKVPLPSGRVADLEIGTLAEPMRDAEWPG
jgi:hypothetical protein